MSQPVQSPGPPAFTVLQGLTPQLGDALVGKSGGDLWLWLLSLFQAQTTCATCLGRSSPSPQPGHPWSLRHHQQVWHSSLPRHPAPSTPSASSTPGTPRIPTSPVPTTSRAQSECPCPDLSDLCSAASLSREVLKDLGPPLSCHLLEVRPFLIFNPIPLAQQLTLWGVPWTQALHVPGIELGNISSGASSVGVPGGSPQLSLALTHRCRAAEGSMWLPLQPPGIPDAVDCHQCLSTTHLHAGPGRCFSARCCPVGPWELWAVTSTPASLLLPMVMSHRGCPSRSIVVISGECPQGVSF